MLRFPMESASTYRWCSRSDAETDMHKICIITLLCSGFIVGEIMFMMICEDRNRLSKGASSQAPATCNFLWYVLFVALPGCTVPDVQLSSSLLKSKL